MGDLGSMSSEAEAIEPELEAEALEPEPDGCALVVAGPSIGLAGSTARKRLRRLGPVDSWYLDGPLSWQGVCSYSADRCRLHVAG